MQWLLGTGDVVLSEATPDLRLVHTFFFCTEEREDSRPRNVNLGFRGKKDESVTDLTSYVQCINPFDMEKACPP